jgi:hypothetical protein
MRFLFLERSVPRALPAPGWTQPWLTRIPRKDFGFIRIKHANSIKARMRGSEDYIDRQVTI